MTSAPFDAVYEVSEEYGDSVLPMLVRSALVADEANRSFRSVRPRRCRWCGR